MQGFLTTETGGDIQCQFETPHPDTIFQIQGLEIVLQDEERKQEIVEMKASEKFLFTNTEKLFLFTFFLLKSYRTSCNILQHNKIVLFLLREIYSSNSIANWN